MRLKDRVAVVTGAGAGIGEGIARRLASEGAALWLADVAADAVARVAESIRRDFGTEAVHGCTDVTDREAVEAMVGDALARFGRVDILVDNAWGQRPGRSGPSGVHSVAQADVEWAMRMAPQAALWAMQAVFPGMKARRWGRIVNLCSLNGVNAHPYSVDYNMAKEALRTLTRTAAREWAPHGICCNAICPGAATDAYRRYAAAQPENAAEMLRFNPMGRMGDPEADIGGVAVFLASEDCRYLTGNTLFVDGGSHINGVPWLPQPKAR